MVSARFFLSSKLGNEVNDVSRSHSFQNCFAPSASYESIFGTMSANGSRGFNLLPLSRIFKSSSIIGQLLPSYRAWNRMIVKIEISGVCKTLNWIGGVFKIWPFLNSKHSLDNRISIPLSTESDCV